MPLELYIEEIWFERNRLSGPLPTFLADALPALKQFFLNFNDFDGATAEARDAMKKILPEDCHVAVLDDDELPSPA